MYKKSELPQRHEYLVGLDHIVVNYNKDGTVLRTINGIEEYYPTQSDFNKACESAYKDYINQLDDWIIK